MTHGCQAVIERINFFNQWRDHNSFCRERIEGVQKRTAARPDDVDFIDDNRRERNLMIAGDGALENQSAAWPNGAQCKREP